MLALTSRQPLPSMKGCSRPFLTISRRYYHWYKTSETPKYSGWSYSLVTLGGIGAAYSVAMIVDVEREKSRRRNRLSFPTYQRRELSDSSSWMGWWRGLRESERTIMSIMAINGAVFMGWRIPTLQALLSKYFTHSIRSHPITLLTSTFSHVSGIHLLVNMVALYSFGRMLHEKMGREQFLAFYLSAGLLSSGGSHIVRSFRRDFSRSLGASGAIFAVAAGCAHQPDVRVSLIFLPFLSVPIRFALPAMMTYDMIGLIKRWPTFDHAAHLAGAMSGYVLYAASMRHIWPSRKKILESVGYPIKRH